MRGAVIEYLIEGHEIQYSRETEGWYVCQRCGAKLLSAMQFMVRECPGPAGPKQVSDE